MKQNKYDDPTFFRKYDQLPRSVCGLEVAVEWPSFSIATPGAKRQTHPGFGMRLWMALPVRTRPERTVRPRSRSFREYAEAGEGDADIEYRRSAIEDLRLDSKSFDLVISSLTLHYVEGLDAICRKVFAWLTVGGSFVFSVEHPIFTACDKQEWCIGPTGERLHWPVDGYLEEGVRRTQWRADNVVKYHRTITSYVNGLIDSGFSIANLQEPGLPRSDEWRRPMFLLLSGVKTR